MEPEEVAEMLRQHPQTVSVSIMDREATEEALGEESCVGTSSGIVLVNEALKAALKKKHFICTAFRGSIGFSDEHSMQMIDQTGRVIGFDIRPEDRHLYEDRSDVVWLSDDFPMFNSEAISSGKVEMVMLPRHLACLMKPLPDHVVVIPATTVDWLLRKRFQIPLNCQIATSIVAF